VANATVPRPVDIKKKADNMGYSCQNLRVYEAAGEGSLFVFRNKTGLRVHIDFLRQDLVQEPGSGKTVPFLDLDPGQTSDPLRANRQLPSATYEYQVLMVQAEIEAEGGSRPGIEIVP
jgi:hypothetical protein